MNEEINNIKTNEEMTEDDTQIVSQTDCEDFAYTILENGIRIDAYTGTDTSIAIPATIENLPVTEIRDRAFAGYTDLNKITIPNSIIEISNKAFKDCENLTEINISDSVIYIGVMAFSCCTRLSKVNLPNSLKAIGNKAFENCHSLTEINIPDSLTEIGNDAFWNCTSLKVVNKRQGYDFWCPDSLTRIGAGAFSGTSIKAISLLSGSKIKESAFSGCPAKIIYRHKNRS